MPLNKSALRRDVVHKELSARSEGAYEFRMQNISAVLQELGLDRVKGYLPAKNVGNVKDVIIDLINELWGRQQQLEQPTDDEVALETRILSARLKFSGSRLEPPPGNKNVHRSKVQTNRFVRDPNVIAWVTELAKGIHLSHRVVDRIHRHQKPNAPAIAAIKACHQNNRGRAAFIERR
jgi:5-methylcytosine-specific restriction protein A